MGTKTVFVSSRMDELAFERRSAFDAIYLRGLTPLLFETEPVDREKEMIDGLVDKATFFVGIYYQSIGQRFDYLGNLEPIAYELYRFLFRYCDAEVEVDTGWKNFTTADVKKRLDKLMEPDGDGPPTAVTELRRRIERGDPDERETRQLRNVLSTRVFLYFKRHAYDTPMSVRLARMLQIFQPQLKSFQSRREEMASPRLPAGVPTDGLAPIERYITTRFALFDLLDRKAEEKERQSETEQKATAADRSGSERVESLEDDAPRYHWRFESVDYPGILYRVLKLLFDRSFNIDLICCGKPPDRPEDGPDPMILDVVAHPFHRPRANPSTASHSRSERTRRKIDIQIESAFKSIEGGVSVKSKPIDWKRWPHVPNYRKQTGGHFYAIETADVPGQILRMTEKIYFYKGNVDLLYFDSRSETLRRPVGKHGARCHEKLLAVDWRGDDDEKEVTSAKFEAESRQGLGVISVRERTGKSFFARLRKARKEAKRLKLELESGALDPEG